MVLPSRSGWLVPCLVLGGFGCSGSAQSNPDSAGGASPTTAVGGAPSTGIAATGSSTGSGDCTFNVMTSSPSRQIATVGVVEWSTDLSDLSSAQIVYSLNNAAAGVLNRGGIAPVNLSNTNHRTLLLGLKQSSTYTFHIVATSSTGVACTSSDYGLSTGTLLGVPTITRTVTNASAQAAGFIVTCSGQAGGSSVLGGGIPDGGIPDGGIPDGGLFGGGIPDGGLFGGGIPDGVMLGGGIPDGGIPAGDSGGAYIIDADGAIVWYASAPSDCSRARIDYEGVNMWMLALNVDNNGGEMRYVSMDGQTSQTNLSGLSSAHHDFAVLPGGLVAAIVWASAGTDPESNLIERSRDGTQKTVFKIGSNLYVGGSSALGGASGSSYHCNSILYHPSDDSYTIGDRNPNLYVKVTRVGSPVWQIGGSCANAPAPKCAAGTWKVNHGHDFDAKNGNLLVFNNGQSGFAHVLELKISDSDSFGVTTVKDYTSGNSSASLGDVQRLSNGNTLITYSNGGTILEVDSSWNTVQTLNGSFGYADWRETLYGTPER